MVSKLFPLTTGIATSAYRTRSAKTARITERIKVTWDGGERFMPFPPFNRQWTQLSNVVGDAASLIRRDLVMLTVRHTPGHTPEHVSYLMSNGAISESGRYSTFWVFRVVPWSWPLR